MTSNLKFNKTLSIALVALSTTVLSAAYAQTPAPAPAPTPTPGKAHSGSMAGMGTGMDMKGMKDMKNMDMQAMMKGNNDQMSGMKMTGNVDVDFAMMMRIHHQGAIDMAQVELRDGKAPEMRKMAKDIIAAQKKEIAQLDRFLAKSGHPVDKMSK